MDAWIHEAEAFGINLGDAHVIRNARGNAEEGVRSLIISQQYLDADQVMVVKHTSKLVVLMAVYRWMPLALVNDWEIVLRKTSAYPQTISTFYLSMSEYTFRWVSIPLTIYVRHFQLTNIKAGLFKLSWMMFGRWETILCPEQIQRISLARFLFSRKESSNRSRLNKLYPELQWREIVVVSYWFVVVWQDFGSFRLEVSGSTRHENKARKERNCWKYSVSQNY